MKKIDFLYVAGMHSDQHVPALSEHFSEIGKSYLVVTENYADYIKWERAGIPVYFISARGPAKPSALSRHLAGRLSIDNIIETEFRYYSFPRKLLRKKFFRLCVSIEKFLDIYDLDVVIQKPGGEIIRRIFFNLPGTKPVCFGESYFSGYSTLYLDEYKTPYPSRLGKVIPDPLALLNKSLGKGKEVKYSAKLADFSQHKLKRLRLLFKGGCFSVLYSYFSHRVKLWPFGAIRRKLSGWLYSRQLDELKGSNKKIFYFPLNVKAESELYVRNFILAEQATICWQLKKLLPQNAELVVKEHPGNSKSLGLFEMFKLWWNGVFIADSSTPSSTILERCDGVVAVSSTVLIEAVQRNIPILVLGAWPYSRCLVDRSCGNSTRQLIEFFNSPRDFMIQAEPFSNRAKQYLHKGSAYSDGEEFRKLLNSIVELKEE